MYNTPIYSCYESLFPDEGTKERICQPWWTPAIHNCTPPPGKLRYMLQNQFLLAKGTEKRTLWRVKMVSGATHQQLLLIPVPLARNCQFCFFMLCLDSQSRIGTCYMQWLKKNPRRRDMFQWFKVGCYYNVLCSPARCCSDPFYFNIHSDFCSLVQNFKLSSSSIPPESPAFVVSWPCCLSCCPVADYWIHWHTIFIFALYHVWWNFLALILSPAQRHWWQA